MKMKLFITITMFAAFTYSNAQSMGDVTKAASSASKTATTAAASSFDVASITNQVMGVLSPKLQLTEAQKPAVNSLVGELLNKKKKNLPTAVSDKAGYTSKMTAVRESFSTKMKKIVNPSQYSTLMGLLPKSASSTSALAKMLY